MDNMNGHQTALLHHAMPLLPLIALLIVAIAVLFLAYENWAGEANRTVYLGCVVVAFIGVLLAGASVLLR